VKLQVVRRKACVLGNLAEHLRANLVAVVEGECAVLPTVAPKGGVRPGDAKGLPANAPEGSQNALCFLGWPPTHAARTVQTSGAGVLIWASSAGASSTAARSSCISRSTCSASTRSASARADRVASSRLWPYAITPGSSGTSQIQRPSSSWSISRVSSMLLLYPLGAMAATYRPRPSLASPAGGAS
jgi:hypothetical protein